MGNSVMRCTQCGLPNYSGETQCKRCGGELERPSSECVQPRSSANTPAEGGESDAFDPQLFTLGGIVFALAAIASLWFFSGWEDTGGERRVNVILYSLYSTLGKWGTAAILAAISAAGFLIGRLGGKGAAPRR